FLVQVSDATSSIDNPDQYLRLIDGSSCLLEDVCRYDSVIVRNNPTSIHQVKLMPGPFDFAVDTVSGNTMLIANDGASFSNQSVKKSGFADVGTSNDRDLLAWCLDT